MIFCRQILKGSNGGKNVSHNDDNSIELIGKMNYYRKEIDVNCNDFVGSGL